MKIKTREIGTLSGIDKNKDFTKTGLTKIRISEKRPRKNKGYRMLKLIGFEPTT